MNQYVCSANPIPRVYGGELIMASFNNHISGKTTERRDDPRKVFTVTMQFMVSELNDSELLECKRGTGITTNLSAGGLGFFTDRCFTEGQSLTVFSNQIAPEPVCAEVRWCSRHSEDLFKVGLAFH